MAGVRDKARAQIVSEANNICNVCHYLIQCSAAAGVLEDVRLFQYRLHWREKFNINKSSNVGGKKQRF